MGDPPPGMAGKKVRTPFTSELRLLNYWTLAEHAKSAESTDLTPFASYWDNLSDEDVVPVPLNKI